MIKCPKCNSENTESTGVVVYTFLSYSYYICKDCNYKFEICNNETIPVIDLKTFKE